MSKKEEKTFEEAMTQLEEIVKKLEQGDLPLEQALNVYKEGIQLSQFCQTTLANAEETVTKMMTEQGEIPLQGETNDG